MKKLYFLFALLVCTLALQPVQASTNWYVGVKDYTFTAVPLWPYVGDTITWYWIDGDHTTTSTSLPAGAASWNAPINSVDTMFSYVITATGDHNFECLNHSGMTQDFFAQAAVGMHSPVAEATNIQLYITNNNLNIHYTLTKDADAHLTLMDMSGRTLFATETCILSGDQNLLINTSNFSKGIYLLTFYTGAATLTRKVSIF